MRHTKYFNTRRYILTDRIICEEKVKIHCIADTMEIDDKLRWLEARLNSSLRPRNEDVKQMYQNDENRYFG